MNRQMLSDAQWALSEPFVFGRPGDPGRHRKDNRLFVEAMQWILRTGSPWRDMPTHLGNWHTTFVRFQRWARSQGCDALLEYLSWRGRCHSCGAGNCSWREAHHGSSQPGRNVP
ncbi:MAG: transposase [Betaproteobacteria bacterium]|nr:transposase [Betaproteobacteria bacterium]